MKTMELVIIDILEHFQNFHEKDLQDMLNSHQSMNYDLDEIHLIQIKSLKFPLILFTKEVH